MIPDLMAKHKDDIDGRVLEALDGRDRIKALLRNQGFETLKAFAQKHNEWVVNVSRCLSGDRPLPQVRDALAEELALSREEIDELIDGEDEEAA